MGELRHFAEAYLRARIKWNSKEKLFGDLTQNMVNEFCLVVELFILVRSVAVAIWWCSLPSLAWDPHAVLDRFATEILLLMRELAQDAASRACLLSEGILRMRFADVLT